MIEVETLIREQLSGLDPLPPSLSADWDDVLSRVQRPAPARRERLRARPRRLALAVSVAAILFSVVSVTTPLGAAIGRSLGDFSDWISGSPGTPASPEDQQAFEQENERSWTRFPEGTQLRRLLQTEAAGMSFELFGFRSGDSLCLRLVASGPEGGEALGCAPIGALQQANEPALVIRADETFGVIGTTPPPNGYLPVRASATFGLASDTVKDVILSTNKDSDDHPALVGGDAFLYVADHPALGMRVLGITAVTTDGGEVALPFSRAPFGVDDDVLDAPTGRVVQGPKGVDRRVKEARIGWLERQEQRGKPVTPEDTEAYHDLETSIENMSFARLIQPDPASPETALLAWAPDSICFGFYFSADRGGYGCFNPEYVSSRKPLGAANYLFVATPFWYSCGIYNGGDQFAKFYGLVSDDVSELQLYLTDGQVQEVKLKDNVFSTYVARAMFPIRIIARDKQGAIIGNEVKRNA